MTIFWVVMRVKRVTCFGNKYILVNLAKSDELFVMVPISDLPTVKYWHNLETVLFLKKIVPKK